MMDKEKRVSGQFWNEICAHTFNTKLNSKNAYDHYDDYAAQTKNSKPTCIRVWLIKGGIYTLVLYTFISTYNKLDSNFATKTINETDIFKKERKKNFSLLSELRKSKKNVQIKKVKFQKE